MTEQETYVIVGAGHAGCRAAEAMRETGFKGRIILVGDEAHRPYERPPVSKQLLHENSDPETAFLQPADFFAEQNIELVLGNPATAINPETKCVHLANGESLAYTKLLLATGSSPRRLPAEMGGDHLLYLRTIDDAISLRRRMQPGARLVLIGGGVIGLEVASVAAGKGCQVTVFEAADRLMGRAVGPEVSVLFHRLHSEHGVSIEYGVTIRDIEAQDDRTLIHLSDGRTVTADLALAGIGVSANTALAEQAGLEVEGGILVDAYGQTSMPDIYAAGEVANHFNVFLGRHQRSETWLHADSHGRLVGANMCGASTAYDEIPWFWTDQYDVNMQVSGDAFGDETVRRGPEGDGQVMFFHLCDGRVAGATAINNGRDMRFAKKLIQAGTAVDPRRLADESVPLKQIAAEAQEAQDNARQTESA